MGAAHPNWMDGEYFLFHGRKMKYESNIFIASINTHKTETIIESRWNDYNPSISPDRTKIVFISDRSGMNEVWLLDRENGTIRQITGYFKLHGVTHPFRGSFVCGLSMVCLV